LGMSLCDLKGENILTNFVRLDNYGDLLSAQDLSEFLGVSKQTAYKEIKKGKFGNPLKFGREYRIPKIYIIDKYFQGCLANA